MKFASALATQPDAVQLADQLRRQLGGPPPDLAVAFIAGFDQDVSVQIAQGLRAELAPPVFLACTAEGVIGTEAEVEQQPAVSVVAASLPGVTLASFDLRPTRWPALLADPAEFEAAVRLPPDCRLILLLADPFSSPIDEILEAFNTLCPGVPVAGGMASGASRPGYNVLVCNERVMNGGAVGVALAGALAVDVVVSQGCRPVGRPYTVTAAEDNLIHSLGDRPPVEQVQSLYAALSPDEQRLMQNGLFIGRAIRSGTDAEALGRGDFLVRGVLGVERQTGALAIADRVRTGETVQFQVRDADTAREDLELLLVPQTFGEPPAGAFLFSCNGRGTRLFDRPNGDISIVTDALGALPLAGFFCAGEIGPVGERNFLHGHTVSLALFRPAPAS